MLNLLYNGYVYLLLKKKYPQIKIQQCEYPRHRK